MARRREQVHGVKPLLQRRVRAEERRADHRVNVLTARARVSGQFGQPLVEANVAAALTFILYAEARPEQMLKTRIIIRNNFMNSVIGMVLIMAACPSLP